MTTQIRKARPLFGRLVLINKQGEVMSTLFEGPWAFLQHKRTELLQSGRFTKDRIKLKHL